MTPIGPFRSSFSSFSVFIIQTIEGIRIVTEGQQPSTGVLQNSMKDALLNLQENGYEIVKA